MGKPFLYLKIILLIYCIYTSLNGFIENTAAALIGALVLLAVSALIPVLKQKKFRILLLLGSLALIFIFFSIFHGLILLSPVIFMELTLTIGVSPVYGSLFNLFLLPICIRYNLEAQFLLIAVFSAYIFFMARHENKIGSLQKQNDELRLLNNRLHKKLALGEDIKSQIAYSTQLEERNKIAQEIHDKIGHSISGSLMQLEAIKVISINNPQKSASMLDTVISTLRGGLESIRMTLRNIKPPAEQMGINRLQLLLSDFEEKHSIKTSFIHTGDISRVSPLVWKIFIENTSEALTNLLRHSSADCVSVSIFVMNKMIRFQINDNGMVLEPVKKGLGLSGMEERLLTVGGRLLIDNTKGFSLTMLIPVEGDSNGNTASIGR